MFIKSELVQLQLEKVLQTRAYTMVLLATSASVDRSKRFAVYVDSSVGKALQLYLTDTEKARPSTHDLFSSVLNVFSIRIKQVVLVDLIDTIYYARIFLEQDHNGVRYIAEIDARPSDCLLLALMQNVPIYGTKEFLDKTLPVEDNSYEG